MRNASEPASERRYENLVELLWPKSKNDSPASSPAVDASEDDLSVATQWQLIRWKFVRHKVAVISLVVIIIFYLFALFAEFLSPYDPAHHDTDYMFMPPQPLRFFDEGKFQLRPFVYGMTSSMDENTFRTTWELDTTQKYPVKLFVRGDTYKFWGLFESDIHLLGVEEGTIFLIGTDKMGRDLLSRIIFGGRIFLIRWPAGYRHQLPDWRRDGRFSGYFGGRHRPDHPAHHRVSALNPHSAALDGAERSPAPHLDSHTGLLRHRRHPFAGRLDGTGRASCAASSCPYARRNM